MQAPVRPNTRVPGQVSSVACTPHERRRAPAASTPLAGAVARRASVGTAPWAAALQPPSHADGWPPSVGPLPRSTTALRGARPKEGGGRGRLRPTDATLLRCHLWLQVGLSSACTECLLAMLVEAAGFRRICIGVGQIRAGPAQCGLRPTSGQIGRTLCHVSEDFGRRPASTNCRPDSATSTSK